MTNLFYFLLGDVVTKKENQFLYTYMSSWALNDAIQLVNVLLLSHILVNSVLFCNTAMNVAILF